jgi:hypothetical protein
VNFGAGFTLTVNRYGKADKFGHRPEPTPHSIDGCAAAPAGSTERAGDQILTLEQDQIYAPYDADVIPTDELVVPEGQSIDAGVYQVDGKPQRWRSPFTGEEFGTVIRLARATGGTDE